MDDGILTREMRYSFYIFFGLHPVRRDRELPVRMFAIISAAIIR